MKAIGICDGHDSGACLVVDGVLQAAVSEERLTGKKRQAGFPYESVRYCLDHAGGKVDAVAVAERSGRGIHRLLDHRYRTTNPNLPMDRIANRLSSWVQNFVAANRFLSLPDRGLSQAVLAPRLGRIGLPHQPIIVEHHFAHALSAAVASGFDEALAVTMDAYGDGASNTVWLWEKGKLLPLCRVPFPHSPALLYGMVTAVLGYVEGDEGKVSGLAATGDPTDTAPLFDRLFTVAPSGFRMTPALNYHRLREVFACHEPADIAAGLQESVQNAAAQWVRGWIQRTGTTRLCLAGGLFANVRLNQVVMEQCGAEELFVFPHVGDGGLCVGAAWAIEPHRGRATPHMYLGPEPGETDRMPLGTEPSPLDEAGLARVAQTLANGGVVGIVQGSAEFGPRALGNRSVLFSPTDPQIADRLSDALMRPKMMPYAPVVRAEDFAEMTDAKNSGAMRFMTVTCHAKAPIAKKAPTAVHVDGTMRLQVVDAQTAPLLHRILGLFKARTGLPLLINTSFNKHTEPIVTTAKRAAELFGELPLQCMILGDRIWWKTEPTG